MAEQRCHGHPSLNQSWREQDETLPEIGGILAMVQQLQVSFQDQAKKVESVDGRFNKLKGQVDELKKEVDAISYELGAIKDSLAIQTTLLENIATTLKRSGQ